MTSLPDGWTYHRRVWYTYPDDDEGCLLDSWVATFHHRSHHSMGVALSAVISGKRANGKLRANHWHLVASAAHGEYTFDISGSCTSVRDAIWRADDLAAAFIAEVCRKVYADVSARATWSLNGEEMFSTVGRNLDYMVFPVGTWTNQHGERVDRFTYGYSHTKTQMAA